MRLSHVAIAVLMSVSAASAATLFNNFSVASGNDDFISSSYAGPLAASFSTRNTGFAFRVLTLSLKAAQPDDGGMIDVFLASDSASGPGTILDTLGTIDDSDLHKNNSKVHLSAFGDILLTAHTRYWIELSDDNTATSSAKWQYSTGDGGIGAAKELYYYNGDVFPDSDGGYVMDVKGTVTPEPASSSMLLLGVGLVIVATKRHKSALLS